MKVTLYANISTNGRVLLSGSESRMVSQEIIGIALQNVIQAGNLVMGRKSYENFEKAFGGTSKIKAALPNVELVCLSTTKQSNDTYKVAGSPEEAIQYLAKKGFSEIIIGGGTDTYNVFLEKDLATDVVFNIIPIITTGGILVTNDEVTIKFKLLKHTLLTDDVIQLRYSKE
jgi:dihydrofolate reductase